VSAVDARIAVAAGPLLARYNAAGVLAGADVHVAQRLGRLSGETDERVHLAVALAVRAVRTGSVCVRLDDSELLDTAEADDGWPAGGGTDGSASSGDAEPMDPPPPLPELAEWTAVLSRSPAVSVGVDGPADRPVRMIDRRVYLDRYWRDEQLVRAAVDRRLSHGLLAVDSARLRAALTRLFPDDRDERPRLAAAVAALSRVTVLTGGPGTGKTTTIARLLAVLHDGAPPDAPALRVALAAPTGKAAARLQEAVRSEAARFDPSDRARVGEPSATTVHRLLGWRPGASTRFRHDRNRHLPHDIVVVDESSMVSLPLMARLLEALRPSARLVLVGDPDQLASVEAGAVLGDLVARPPAADLLPPALGRLDPGLLNTSPPDAELRNGVVRLVAVHRFGAEIGALANAIRSGDVDATLDVLRAGGPAIEWVVPQTDSPSPSDLAGLRADVEAAGLALVGAAAAGDASTAVRALDRHRVLVAHRRGRAGAAFWAAEVEAWIAHATGQDVRPRPLWYAGRPLLVTANDPETGLYNGDTGVVVDDGSGHGIAAFGDAGAPRLVRLYRLPAVETVYAMTVHRGQGSSFDTVSVVLPPASSPLLTRELLYTAITRARLRVRVVGTEAAVRRAVQRPVRRASGLRDPVPRG
jgi:exodeoxyribonuclease V alpha subunit